MAAITTAILATAAIGMQVHSMEEAKSAERQSRRDQEKANAIEAAKTSVERARERRRAIAATRIAQAQNEAVAVGQGVTGSSQVEGAQSSISSGLASGMQSANRSFVSGQQSFNLRQSAADTMAKGQRRAQNFQALSGMFGQAASMSASFASPSAAPTPSGQAPNMISNTNVVPNSAYRYTPNSYYPLR